MSETTEVLSPAAVAAAVAPVIDRLRLAVASRVPERARDLAVRLNLSPQGLQTLAVLRNAMPDRVVDRAGIDAVFVYTLHQQVEAAVAELVGESLIAAHESGTVALNDRGREVVAELYAVTGLLVDELWADHEDLSNKLAALVHRAVAARRAPGGRPSRSRLRRGNPPVPPPRCSWPNG
ncbi:MAG: hypothetical protein Q8K58_09645 [Acidimicrobiales bacterium]|nr:hypothetical protein [Acidimicrobiales bacterium]